MNKSLLKMSGVLLFYIYLYHKLTTMKKVKIQKGFIYFGIPLNVIVVIWCIVDIYNYYVHNTNVNVLIQFFIIAICTYYTYLYIKDYKIIRNK